MSHSTITPILRYALELCNSKDHGGRIVETNKTSGAILDCSCWPDDYSHALLARYPSCTIAFVSAQDISATGFSVFITMEKKSIWDHGYFNNYSTTSSTKGGILGSCTRFLTPLRFLLPPLPPMPGMMVLGCMVAMVVDMVSMLGNSSK